MNSNLSTGNVNHVPDDRHNNMVERFRKSSAGDEPYFARARLEEHSAHASRLTSQIIATEKAMKK